jgi:hypothetical protein
VPLSELVGGLKMLVPEEKHSEMNAILQAASASGRKQNARVG